MSAGSFLFYIIYFAVIFFHVEYILYMGQL
jgi:hypothetical protein